jgi:asparagine synthase (glutamine-hydrolysing)
MCGIAGVIDLNSAQPGTGPGILKNMSDVIIHRGPDSDGQWQSPDKKCGLAFRRLAIIDLSELGNQPMHTQDGRYHIVFNGEIYNHADIRKELEKRGYKYNSGTDTETILYGFAEFGLDILQKMHGMWAIAIWDSRDKKLMLSRDRLGIKPLYFYNKNGVFLFGSEIKSILQHPSSERDINIEELPNYLNYSASSNRGTLFKDVHKIPAGHLLTYEAGEINLRRFWSPVPKDEIYNDVSEKEAQEKVIDLLRDSIEARMMSDVPFGVFLSGGIDSSLNVALMAELMNRPVDTFTVGFKELEKYNELGYARQISEKFSTNHHEILIDETDAEPIMQKLAWHEDEPNGDPVCIPLYFLSKLTRDSGTTVVQVGEGSDEQFVGYSWMLRDYNFYRTFWKFYTGLPSFIRKATYGIVRPILESRNQYQMLDYFRKGTLKQEFYWSGTSVIGPPMLERLSPSNLSTEITPDYAANLHKSALNDNPNLDYLQRMVYVELYNRIAEILLMRVDKIGMAHSIEARVPFLDHRLVEFTMKLPPHIRVPQNKLLKDVLKKAVEGILPHEIIYRKKQGFAAPVAEWLRGPWKKYATDKIMNSRLHERGLFDKNFIKKLIETHAAGKAKFHNQIFMLLMLAEWYDVYFD